MPLFAERKPIANRFTSDADLVLYDGDVVDFLAALPDNIAQLYRVLREDGSICWQVGDFVEDGQVLPRDIPITPSSRNLDCSCEAELSGISNTACTRPNDFRDDTRRSCGSLKATITFSISMQCACRPNIQASGISEDRTRASRQAIRWGRIHPICGQSLKGIGRRRFGKFQTSRQTILKRRSTPCQFPIELVERCGLALTNEGDWVFDPYAGVGSALIAATKHNRRAMGCEKEARYVEIARQRLTAFFNGALAIRPLGKPVYVPTGREKVLQIPDEWKRVPPCQLLEHKRKYK